MSRAMLWVDNGARTAQEVAALLELPYVSAVIGSEMGLEPDAFGALNARFPDRLVLSLDFRADGYVGDPALLADATCWPDRVIVMTLARIGGEGGPDLTRIAGIKQRAGDRAVYAAGGIRHRGDLKAAHEAGASGALVATALHAQTLTAADL